jgi:ketosteroid isomerase-like protein
MTTQTNTTTAVDHAATVGAMYEAFGRGDVPFILEQLRDDVAWEDGIRDTAVPWLRPGSGKQHVVQFFTSLDAGLQFTDFEPQTIAQSGDTVVAVIREGAISKSTGRTVPADLYVHIWRFDREGKVAAFRHVGDWYHQEQALS